MAQMLGRFAAVARTNDTKPCWNEYYTMSNHRNHYFSLCDHLKHFLTAELVFESAKSVLNTSFAISNLNSATSRLHNEEAIPLGSELSR